MEASKENEGSGFHGMYFRINGKLIHVKGANVVPMSQFESYHSDEAHQILVESANAANMNMLRVWGGGMIFPDSFYDACDKHGILVYHDLMFVEEQFHSPHESKDVEEEIRYIVRSLVSHPSIVLWNGCNECNHEGRRTDIYSDFVMKIVAEEDSSRPIWPSSPSISGWKTGVYRDSGRPNGNKLSYWTSNESITHNNKEVHGPYLHGSPLNEPFTVNGHSSE